MLNTLYADSGENFNFTGRKGRFVYHWVPAILHAEREWIHAMLGCGLDIDELLLALDCPAPVILIDP